MRHKSTKSKLEMAMTAPELLRSKKKVRKMKVFLRAFEPGDYRQISKWRADDEVMTLTGGSTLFVSAERERRWVEEKIMHDEKNLHLAICLHSSAEMIGWLSLGAIDWRSRKTEIGVVIGRKNLWNKGYGAEACRLGLTHAFNELNLHRVYAMVLKSNGASISMFERLGFRIEGVLRDSVYKGGSYHDQMIISLLRDEYQTLRAGKR